MAALLGMTQHAAAALRDRKVQALEFARPVSTSDTGSAMRRATSESLLHGYVI
jgi:hypothetical protein